jgi:hypothetical protein
VRCTAPLAQSLDVKSHVKVESTYLKITSIHMIITNCRILVSSIAHIDKMTSAKSISDILDATLLIEGDDTGISNQPKPNAEMSTSRILLNRLNEEASAKTDEFLKLATPKVQVIDPLIAQIAASKTDAPKYWNSSGMKSSSGDSSILSLKAKEMTSQINNPAGHKKKVVKKSKGEAYSDRLQSKVTSQQHRRQRLEKYSNMY